MKRASSEVSPQNIVTGSRSRKRRKTTEDDELQLSDGRPVTREETVQLEQVASDEEWAASSEEKIKERSRKRGRRRSGSQSARKASTREKESQIKKEEAGGKKKGSKSDPSPAPKKKGSRKKITTSKTSDCASSSGDLAKASSSECTRSGVFGEGDNAMSYGSSMKFIGAHVSAAGGIEKSVQRALDIGCRAFAMFTRSQRTWAEKPLEKKNSLKFKENLVAAGISPHLVLPHGSYLVNLGSPDEETRKKSFNCFLGELQRCNKLGIPGLNIHPGSTKGEISAEECIDRIAEGINWAFSQCGEVSVVLENTAGGGGTIGRTFGELRALIDKVDDKKRVGVCLDTCHLFAAGYDIRSKETYESTMEEFEEVVGFKWLRGIHLNDSKMPLGSRKDRHERIGKGEIGLDCFRFIMNDSRLDNIPIILETPDCARDAEEIRMLYSFVEDGEGDQGEDAGGDESKK